MAVDDAVMLELVRGRVHSWFTAEEDGTVRFAMEKWTNMGDGLQQQPGYPITLHPTFNNGQGNNFTVAFNAVAQQVSARQKAGACQPLPQGYIPSFF
jgi:hypothetical protein